MIFGESVKLERATVFIVNFWQESVKPWGNIGAVCAKNSTLSVRGWLLFVSTETETDWTAHAKAPGGFF